MVAHWVELQVAGLWPLIWHFGIGGGLLLACAAGWYFSPIHRVDFIWGAVVIIVVMVSTSIGVSLGEKRKQAQWDASRSAAFEDGKQARAGAVRDIARKPYRWMPAQRDSYDCDRHRDPVCGMASDPLLAK
jgi:hypothetical protein